MYRLGTTQTVAIGASTAASTAFGAQTRAVRVIATSNAHIVVAKSATATTSDTYLALGREEVIQVAPGEQVAVIQNSAGGTLYITELTH